MISVGEALAMTSVGDASERIYIVESTGPVETVVRPLAADCAPSYCTTWALVNAIMQGAVRRVSLVERAP